MEEMGVNLVVGPLSSWPDEWLDRAVRLCTVTIENAQRASAPADADLDAELSQLQAERTRRLAQG